MGTSDAHSSMLCSAMLCYVALVVLCCTLLYYGMPRCLPYVVLCYNTLRYVVLCYNTLRYVVRCYDTSRYVVLTG